MAAHSAPSSRRQLRITALTSFATALAVVGLLVLGSVLTTAPPGRDSATLGTTTGPVTLVDAAVPASSTDPTPPAVRTSATPRPSAKPTTTTTTTTTTRKPTTTTADDDPDDSGE